MGIISVPAPGPLGIQDFLCLCLVSDHPVVIWGRTQPAISLAMGPNLINRLLVTTSHVIRMTSSPHLFVWWILAIGGVRRAV